MIINDLPCPQWKLYLEMTVNVIMLGKTVKTVFILSVYCPDIYLYVL